MVNDDCNWLVNNNLMILDADTAELAVMDRTGSWDTQIIIGSVYKWSIFEYRSEL